MISIRDRFGWNLVTDDPFSDDSATATRADEPQPTQPSTAQPPLSSHPAAKGMFLAVLSALFYTAANMTLRRLAGAENLDAIWITCNKALIPSLAAWAIIAWRASQGLPALPPRKMILPLLAAGVLMQIGGNFMFQLALGYGGLALTVPLCFATLITTGALLGRIFLEEAITPRTAIAMGVLVIAIALLSLSAPGATESVVNRTGTAVVVLAILTACLSGVGYGACGVVIRRMVTQQIPLSATLVLMSSTGVVGFGAYSLIHLGPAQLATTTFDQWAWMMLAGMFTAVAFFAVGGALKYITVVQANMLNATQSAMCAIAGVMFFAEPWTYWLILGTLLTAAGVMLVEKKMPPAPAKRR